MKFFDGDSKEQMRMEMNMDKFNFLREQNVDPGLIEALEVCQNQYPVDEAVIHRVVRPQIPFFGREVLEMGIAALLKGENLLAEQYQTFAGFPMPKATFMGGMKLTL